MRATGGRKSRGNFDAKEFVRKGLESLTTFQRATVEQIDRLFREGRRRVLVADEVGLGKTRVARGVVAKTAALRVEEGDDLFKVAYVCGSQNIVRQNLRALAPDDESAIDENPEEGRLSMQHLLVAEGDAKRKANGEFLQLIPITPETSFRVGEKTGTKQERALIHAVLDAMPEYTPHNEEILLRLQGNCSTDSFRESTVPYYARFMRLLYKNSPYPTTLHSMLRQSCLPNPESSNRELMRFDAFREQMLRKPASASFNKEIGILRQLFAKISAELLEPDLVILDEFQRFRYLIDPPEGEDGGEVKVLFDRFLREGTADEKKMPRVLMLSATPFKPYSTREECGAAGEEESFREFKGVVDFLFGGKDGSGAVWDDWVGYGRELAEFLNGRGAEGGALLTLKQRVERKLRRGICRTERSLAEGAEQQADGGRWETMPTPEEIRDYVQLSEWARKMGVTGRIPLPYAKSAPYLLSFLGNYKEQERLETALKEHPGGVAALERDTPQELRKTLWLEKGEIGKYRPVPWRNARLALLAEHAFARGAEKWLWIPPTVPCYELGGPFAGSAGYSKVLAFSQWQMVPKMASSLLSYEVERRTVAKVAKKRDYFAETRISARLQFDMKNRRTAGMLLFALLYPSQTLAELFSSAECMNGGRSCAEKVAKRLEREIRKRIAAMKWPSPKGGRVDFRWYYLVPMFLDGRANALDWCRQCEKAIGGGEEDKRAFHLHMQQLVRELESGPEGLGKRPEDLCGVLADMALGAPAVCLSRAGFSQLDATKGADAFRSHFNSPEAIAAVECSYPRSGDAHWKSVLRYGRDGCLQAVLDEWLFQMDETGNRGNDALERIEKALGFRTTFYKADTFEALKQRVTGDGNKEEKWMPLRTHFAAAFAEEKGQQIKGVDRRESLRTAFNSPFRPFVLVSTSIGQEGLDFHRYCRKVFHWNLPHNPIDLEQREGRVDRFRGLAVRQNVAEQFSGKRDFRQDVWKELFAAAEETAKSEGGRGAESGLVPNWRNGDGAPCRVERIVPLPPCSEDERRYERMLELLSLFRVALGQPRQEELLELALRNTPGNLRSLFLDLCPFQFRGS